MVGTEPGDNNRTECQSNNVANRCFIASAMYSATAWIVEVGFTPPDVTHTLPSTMKRFFTSWQRPQAFTTERSGSVPIRAVPSKCPGLFDAVARDAEIRLAPAAARISSVLGNAMLHHPPRVLADAIFDAGRGNAVTVLHFRIQRDAVVLFRQVLAGDTDAQPVTVQLTEDVMVFTAPWQTPGGDAIDRLGDRAGAAGEL